MNRKILLIKKITAVIKDFPLPHLRELVKQDCFPNLQWKTLVKELIENHVRISAAAIRKSISAKLKIVRLTVLRDICLNLLLYCVARRSTLKKWDVYLLQNVDNKIDPQKWMPKRVMIECQKKITGGGLKCLAHNGLIWIVVIKMDREKGTLMWSNPVYIAAVPYERILYVSGPVEEKVLDVLAEALNFHTPKKLPCYGYEIPVLRMHCYEEYVGEGMPTTEDNGFL